MKNVSSQRTSQMLFSFAITLLLSLVALALLPHSLSAAHLRADTTPTPIATVTPSPTTNPLEILQARLYLSEARRLAAQSLLVRPTGQTLSLLLAAEAFKRVENDETRDVLFTGLETNLAYTLRYTQPGIVQVAFSDAANLVALAARNKQIYLLEIPSGKTVGEPLTGQTAPFTALAFSPDGKTVAAGSTDGSIRLWETDTHQLHGMPLLGHTNKANALAFSPDSKILFSGGLDKTLRRWDAATGQAIGEPIQTGLYVGNLLFSPDGKLIALHDNDGPIQLRDSTSGALVSEPRLIEYSGRWDPMAYSPDSKYFASSESDGTVQVWDIANQKTLFRVRGNPDQNSVGGLIYSGDGAMLAVILSASNIQYLDAHTGEYRYAPFVRFPGGTFTGQVVQGGTLLPLSADQDAIEFWELRADSVWQPLLGLPLFPSNEAAFSSDGKWLVGATCSGEGRGGFCPRHEIELWDMQRRQYAAVPLPANVSTQIALAFSANSTQLAFTNCPVFDEQKNCTQNEILVWDMVQGKTVGLPIPTNGPASAITYFPNGNRLAFADAANAIQIWDIPTGKVADSALKGHIDRITRLIFSPDGKQLASASADHTVRLWDMTAFTPTVQVLVGHTERVTDVIFSPDGKTLASAGADGSIRLWDAANGKHLGAPLLSNAIVSTLAFSADGKLLAGGQYNAVSLWDVKQRKLIRVWDVERGFETSVPPTERPFGGSSNLATLTFQVNDLALWTVTQLGIVRQTAVSKLLQPPLERLCQKINRNLTHAEWTQYLDNGSETFADYQQHPTCADASVEK